tara:strand:+ start:203 stop:1318 length:1116 start_codon:yes stop_codon:yes gene_type:complete
MNKKKILNFIPNFYFGGVENSNITLSNELKDIGYDVDFRTNTFLDSKFKDTNEINIKSFDKPKMSHVIFDLIKYIKNENPHLIICSQFYANIIIVIACLFSGYKNKLIISERVPVNENLKNISFFKRIVLKMLIKFLYSNVDHIICNSYGTKYELEKLVKGVSSTVIYNPVISNKIDDLSNTKISDYEFDKDCVYLVTVSRISYEKNISDMIDIISSLNTEKKFKLLIIGEGKCLDSLKEKVNLLGLNTKIEFLGFKNNPYKYLSKCDIYLSTSKFEGLGNSIVEALHFGLNVVSYNSPGGIAEVLSNGKYGKLVDVGSKSEFADYLGKNLFKKNNKDFEYKSLKEHLLLFDSKLVSKQFVKLVQEVIDEK